jgi:predicted anti-sigma-YlaC factor YlaD
MTPPEEHHRYREQIGAFLLGKLDGGERTAVQTHLNSCPICQAEVRELEPVVAALASAAPDRIDEDPRPPWYLEELTLAPILGEIHHARRRRRLFRWSTLAAAAICVVVIGLAGFTWLMEQPEVSEHPGPQRAYLKPLSFSEVVSGVEVEGNLIAHAWGTEIRLVASGLPDGQTHGVTLISEDGERVKAGTFFGTGDKPLRGTFNAALLRKDAARLEVRTPDGELVFVAEPKEPRTGPSGPESTEGPSTEGSAPPDTPDKPKPPGSGGGPPRKEIQPESDFKRPSPGGEKPGAAPEESEPGRDLHEQPPYDPPPQERTPADDQYKPPP